MDRDRSKWWKACLSLFLRPKDNFQMANKLTHKPNTPTEATPTPSIQNKMVAWWFFSSWWELICVAFIFELELELKRGLLCSVDLEAAERPRSLWRPRKRDEYNRGTSVRRFTSSRSAACSQKKNLYEEQGVQASIGYSQLHLTIQNLLRHPVELDIQYVVLKLPSFAD